MQVAEVPINKIAEIMQDMPQAECPVVHRFGEGIYIREVTMPAGTLAVGHIQKFKQNNFLLQGKIAMIGDDGVKILQAPLFFVGEPGRKIGLVLEDIVWQNIWSTDETDIETLEDTYMEKSSDSVLKKEQLDVIDFISREADRIDYNQVIEDSPFTHEQVKIQVENEFDQIKMPEPWNAVTTLRKSNIQGKGMFSTWPIESHECIGPARIDGKRTPLGRYTNHSVNPNSYPIMEGDDVYLYSSRSLDGCKGGSFGEEITVDYRDMLKLSGIEL
jgi:hypothetical protein